MIKVLIVDDEKGMRVLLRKIIEKVEGFEVVAESCNGEDGLMSFIEYKPNIVFLDVEMPKVSGIECGKNIADISPTTKIIFATAFSDYMDKAFELYAFDYLIKPFKVERVFKTLERIKNTLIEDKKSPEIDGNLNKILIKNKEGASLITKDEILLIQKEESQTAIYTDNNKYSTSQSLVELEEKLKGNNFFRCHKSYIINLNKITSIEPYGRWTYMVKLNGIKIDALMTHNKYDEFKNKFNL